MAKGWRQCLRTWKNQFADIGAGFWRLQFFDAEKEKAFARGASTRLAGVMQSVGLVIFLLESAWIFMIVIGWQLQPDVDVDLVTVGATVVDAARGFVGFVMAVSGRLHARRGVLSSRQVESVVVVSGMSILILSQFAERHIMARFLRDRLGYSASRVGDYPDTCELFLVLIIDAIVTMISLSPARWSSLWPLYMLAMLWYPVVATVRGQAGSETVPVFVMLAFLVYCAMVGKRAMEGQERRQFVTVANERTLRAESEFRLSQHGDPTGKPISMAVQSNAGQSNAGQSAIGTLASQDIFADEGDPASGIESTFERIMVVGKREQWLISTDEVAIHLSSVIGRGGFGVVMEGTFCGLPVAVKLSLSPLKDEGIQRFASFVSELRILRKLRHPNIVLFQGAVIDPAHGELALAMELVVGTDLGNYIMESKAPPSDENMYRLCCGVSSALQYLHKHRPAIVHGDLKPGNVLVELIDAGAPRAKLADFGLSRILKGRVREMGGTLAWVAPELLKSQGFPHVAADTYALGRVMIFMMSKTVPFFGWTHKEISKALGSGELPKATLPAGSSSTFSLLWLLAERCCSVDPADRPVMKDICYAFRDMHMLPQVPTEVRRLAQSYWGRGRRGAAAQRGGASAAAEGGHKSGGEAPNQRSSGALDSMASQSTGECSDKPGALAGDSDATPWDSAVPSLRRSLAESSEATRTIERAPISPDGSREARASSASSWFTFSSINEDSSVSGVVAMCETRAGNQSCHQKSSSETQEHMQKRITQL